jgi:hypothetical protein
MDIIFSTSALEFFLPRDKMSALMSEKDERDKAGRLPHHRLTSSATTCEL